MKTIVVSKATDLRFCPGLSVDKHGIIFTDSIGRKTDLTTDKRLSTQDVARQMQRSVTWVKMQITADKLYPFVYLSCRTIEIFQCAVNDYLARHIVRGKEMRSGATSGSYRAGRCGHV